MARKKEKRGATVRDVAERAGVHPGTVSRVLNTGQRDRISEETALRVERAARELGYEVNSFARGLRTRKSFTIGVIMPDLTNPVFPPIVRGIEDHLDPLGFTAFVTNTDADPERENRALRALARRPVDGLMATVTESGMEVVQNLIKDGMPVVLINRSLPGIQAFSVTPDDRGGATAAIERLFALGHESIVHVGGPQTLSPGLERYRAFRDVLREHGIKDVETRAAFAGSFTGGAGVAPTQELLERVGDFTAVFAANDLLALDCIETLKAAGCKIPEDVSVIGFNDMPFAELLSPPLTTVRFSHYEIGVRAAELLIAQINGDAAEPRTVVLSTELAERGSTAPPPSERGARKPKGRAITA